MIRKGVTMFVARRPPNRKSRTLAFTAALVTALTTALVGPAGAAGSAKDVLTIGKSADPQTLDPGVTVDNNDWTVTYYAYQRLVHYKTLNGKGSTEVEPELAESWSVSADGLTWDFKLK